MPFTMWRVLVWHDVLSSACGFVAALVRRGPQMMRVDKYDLGLPKPWSTVGKKSIHIL